MLLEKIEELLKTARQRAAQQKLIKQDDGKNVSKLVKRYHLKDFWK